MSMPRVILAAVAAALLSSALVGASAAATPKEQLRDKQAQAQHVLGEVNQLDARFGATVEAWNGAKYELGLAQKELAADRASLRVAERQRRLALKHVTDRVVALYEGDPAPSTLAIFLGARSLGDVIDELQAAHAVAAADHRLAVQATVVRDRYAKAVRNVDQLDQQRSQIGSLLTQRRALLASVQSEVDTLRAEEARRQAALEAEAKARLAREAAAQRAQARADAAAAAAAKTQAASPDPTTAAAPPTAPATTTTVVAPVETTPSGPISGGHPEAATIALRYLGVPYQWGGSTPAGFDCSGLVMYVYSQLGIALPHFAAAQYGFGSAVPRDLLQPGDLVFFENLDHVGIYIGGGQVVHAPSTGDVVKISNLADWGASYVGARRI
jgi:cell wall-associated NlpC family hydrolase